MPRLSDQLKKELYLESLRKRVRHLFVYGESHPSEKELIAAKLNGFLEVASLIQICSRDELQKVIDEEHLSIFGLSRGERSKRLSDEGALGEADWSVYDTPATGRVRSISKRPRRYMTRSLKDSASAFLSNDKNRTNGQA